MIERGRTFLNVILVILIAFGLFIVSFIGVVLIDSIPHVDIESYTENIDYGVLSGEQIKTFDDIINAVQNGESTVTCPVFSVKEQHEILTHLGMYFGAIGTMGDLVHWNDNDAKLNLDKFKKLLDQKIIIDARIDEAVSTLTEGSDEYKLWQISNYIAGKIEYTKGFRNTISALNGKGVCDSYAMLFYKMATRLGIQSYICYGYGNGDTYHAWNMVELNGEYIYYDITWYDDYIRDVQYIHSESAWDRNFQINNKWSTDLNS